MSELSMFVGTAVQQGGGGQRIEDIQKKVIVRTQGKFPPNTSVDINTPGPGWIAEGASLSFASTQVFLDYAQVYRNGQLICAADFAGPLAADVYVSVIGPIILFYFDYHIATNDVITVWKYSKAIS